MTSNGGNVDVEATTGTSTINQQITTAGGDLAISGGTSAVLAADLTTDAAGGGGNVVLTSPQVVLGEPIEVSTGADSGNITFNGVVNSEATEANPLTLTAGTGDIAFNDAVGLGPGRELGAVTIDSVRNLDFANSVEAANLNQVAGTGGTTFDGVVTVTDAAGVAVTTAGDINVNADMNAENGVSDANLATGESITLNSGATINIAPVTLSTANVVPSPGPSPDSATVYTSTGDAVTINAATAVNFAAGSEIVTDAGVANTFGITLPPGALSTVIDNQIFGSPELLLNAFNVLLGATGEVNLQVHIDWRDPVNGELATPASSAGIFNDLTSNRYQTFTVGEGGQVRTIGHVYSTINIVSDMNLFAQANLAQFIADFSISHHDSIQVSAASVVLTSTDQPGGGGFEPLDSLPPNDANFTGVGSTDEVADNTDLAFESGLVTINVPTQQAGQVRVPAPPVEVAVAQVAEAPPEPEFIDYTPAPEEIEVSLASPTFGTQDYYQLRRRLPGSDELEILIDRIEESQGDALNQPAKLNALFEGNEDLDGKPLQEGSGYELWLITEDEERGIRIERPVFKFEITDGKPAADTDELEDEMPDELKLVPVPDPDGNDTTALETDGEVFAVELLDGGSEPASNETAAAATMMGVAGVGAKRRRLFSFAARLRRKFGNSDGDQK